MSVRRMLPFLLVNIVVSAVVVLAILYFWDGRTPAADDLNTAVNSAVVTPDTAVNAASTPVFVPPTETPAPADDGPTVHIVAAGDTLGTISTIYGVTLEDIMAANGLNNANIISVGQELTIPSEDEAEEVVVEEATAVPAENVLPTPIATEVVVEGGDVIVEITAVIGVGQLEDEAVQIRNRGNDSVALLGWKLADSTNRVYIFGQATLFGGGTDVLVHTMQGVNGPTDFYWGLSEATWQPGETVTLLDAEDSIVATYVIPQ